jgi:predicted RNase H-like nuclease
MAGDQGGLEPLHPPTRRAEPPTRPAPFRSNQPAPARAARWWADRLSRENGGIGVGAHAWALAKKLREVDALMTPARQQVIREVHPELSFQEMVGRPPDHSKKTTAGKQQRIAALIEQGFPASFVRSMPNGLRVGQDDFLDACAALWTAERIYRGSARRIPPVPERDVRALDMAIWF